MSTPSASRPSPVSDLDRRTLLYGAGGAAAALTLRPSFVHAQGSDTIRVGLIGCGGRGSGAAVNCWESSKGVEVVAMGDLFPDRLQRSRANLSEALGAAMKVTDATAFAGWDAFERVLGVEAVNLVILATPPHFRPQHLEAAVRAGKNVFMEKPAAVDPTGVRRVIAAADEAKKRGLAIVAGTQRRHQKAYLDTIARVRDGAIGELVGGSCYWNTGGLWMFPRQSEWSDMEWQLRNWLYFTWLSGDHICEQHVHQLDVMNWVMGATPLAASGMGGREVRTDPAYGNIYDHHAVEFEYPGGVLVHSYCRQIEGCDGRVDELIVGSKGRGQPGGTLRGATEWSYDSEGDVSPYVQEHADLIASIRAGQPLNEGRQVAESTMSAILGRMATYSGKRVEWKVAMASDLDLAPPSYAFGPLPVRPVAVPGAAS